MEKRIRTDLELQSERKRPGVPSIINDIINQGHLESDKKAMSEFVDHISDNSDPQISYEDQVTANVRYVNDLITDSGSSIIRKYETPKLGYIENNDIRPDIKTELKKRLSDSVNSDTLSNSEKVALLVEICTLSKTILKERFDVTI